MTLQHVELTQLSVSPLNVRKYGAKDCAELVTSIRALGLLQPLLVRKSDDRFEVIAGQRRLNACRILAEESDIDPIPCLLMAEGDDAKAIEASLAENIERLPMDEIDQYKAFTKLAKEGRSTEDIASTFGITERMVGQRLALGNLHPPILTAYRKDDIHARDIRILTMASLKQQKAWWALVKDDDAHAPSGQHLKGWLFGGADIPTENALFDVAASGLLVVSDLFGEHAYFADAEAFWPLQNSAIAERADTYRADGWADVVINEVGTYFASWDHCTTDKAEGGKVFITVNSQGEVTFHEGYLTSAEAKRKQRGEDGETVKPDRPELTKPMQNYLALHRHAAVRQDLLSRPDMALRLVAAHMISGSSLWDVQADPQKTTKPEIADSLATNTAQQVFEVERAAIAKMLGMSEVTHILPSGHWSNVRPNVEDIFAALRQLEGADITRILTFAMVESLAVGADIVETLAADCGTDMSAVWSVDETFFTLLRDKEALNGIVAELAGDTAAKEHITSTAKTQKAVIKACLDGTRISKVEIWSPRYMQVPMQGYTSRSGFGEAQTETTDTPAIAAE